MLIRIMNYANLNSNNIVKNVGIFHDNYSINNNSKE